MKRPKWITAIKDLSLIKNSMDRFDPLCYLEGEGLPDDMPDCLKKYTTRILEESSAWHSNFLTEQKYRYSALQSQINPHFLYNTLECIRSEALLCHNGSIAEMTERLSRFFRYCISNQGDFVTLRDEITNIKDYFFIQQYRFGSRFALHIDLDDEMVLENHMPKMTLQPVVENAIYHGLEDKKGGGTVCIKTTLTEKKVYVWISDDGIGMTKESVDRLNENILHPQRAGREPGAEGRHKGIALYNVNARIQLHFGSDYGLRVSSLPGKGTDVEIILPRLDILEFSRRFKREGNGT